jgi:hypothetical protein
MDTLVEKHTVTQVRKALEDLSNAIDRAYDEPWERIQRQSEDERKLAKRVLSWITHAVRPLHLAELQHALAVVDGETWIDPEKITDKVVLTSVCAGLVVNNEDLICFVRKDPAFDMRETCAYLLQITRRRNISNANETHCSQKLRPASRRHASRISHSMFFLASVKTLKN